MLPLYESSPELSSEASRRGQWVGHFPGSLVWDVVTASPRQLDLPVALVKVVRRCVFRLPGSAWFLAMSWLLAG